MCGWFYLNTMHADHANLIMQYLSIRQYDLKIRHTLRPLKPQDQLYDIQ